MKNKKTVISRLSILFEKDYRKKKLAEAARALKLKSLRCSRTIICKVQKEVNDEIETWYKLFEIN
ncbi:MAG TPA: hypothetical protein EYN38_08230 [Flavobacteriales bacterium]|nr:hypothetical protein [Flavobacteriales bacterium]HIO73071.1 hypothetical protein [Flavobacteriales bacterium]